MSYFIIIAGNKQQFLRWVQDWGYAGDARRKKSDFTYLSRPDQLRGLNMRGGHKIIFVGTYWESAVYGAQELDHAIRESGARPMIFGDEDFYKRLKSEENTVTLLTKFAALCAPFALRYLWGKKTPTTQFIREIWCELIGRGISLPVPDLAAKDIAHDEPADARASTPLFGPV